MEHIIIEIHGGVANVVKKPIGVELIIKDFDISDENDVDYDEDGNPYIEEIYDANAPVPYIGIELGSKKV